MYIRVSELMSLENMVTSKTSSILVPSRRNLASINVILEETTFDNAGNAAVVRLILESTRVPSLFRMNSTLISLLLLLPGMRTPFIERLYDPLVSNPSTRFTFQSFRVEL